MGLGGGMEKAMRRHGRDIPQQVRLLPQTWHEGYYDGSFFCWGGEGFVVRPLYTDWLLAH